MKPNEKQILQLLRDTPGLVTIAYLSNKTGFTERYIRNIVKEIHNNEDGHGYSISYVFRKGIELDIYDSFAFNTYMMEEEQSTASRIAMYLLEKNKPVPSQRLQDNFYLSKTTLDHYMKKVREILLEYDLILSTEGHQGFVVLGKELNKRVCFSRNVKERQFNDKVMLEIRKIVLSVLKEYHYEISDENIDNLCHHIKITLHRIYYKEYSNESLELKEDYPTQKEMAREIVKRLEKKYKLDIPEMEVPYLVLHLLTKQLVQENDEITTETRKLAIDILERIKEENHVDLTKQFDMQFNLCLHLQPMLIRVEYGVTQDNPLKENIKRELSHAYELALTAKKVILEEKNLVINDSETSYLALHFALGLDRIKEKKDFKVLIVCTTGNGTSRLLAHQLMSEYDLDEEEITVTSLYKLQEYNLAEYSCLLSTLPLQEEIPIPYMVIPVSLNAYKTDAVKSFLSKQMKAKKETFQVDGKIFLEIDVSTREDVLKAIVSYLPNEISKEEMYSALIKREMLSSTEVGNRCALPHPVKINVERSLLYFVRLKRPIIWETEKVQLVIFSAWTENEDSNLSEMIINLVSNPQAIQELLENFGLDTFNRLVEVEK